MMSPTLALEHHCNYRSRSECPLQHKCLTEKIVYWANVENDTNNEQRFYFDMSETSFKKHLGNHKTNILIVNIDIV